MDEAWGIVVASFLMTFLIDGSILSFGPYLRPMQNDLQDDAPHVAFISSVQYGCFQLSGPLIGVMVNLFGFRNVALAGGTVAGLGKPNAY